MNIAQVAERKKIRLRPLIPQNYNIEPEYEPNEETLKAIEMSFNSETLIECEDFDDMIKKCELKCCG